MPSEKRDPRKAKASSSSASSSASKSASKPKSAAELRQEEWDTFITDSVKSHAGWLAQPILSLSSQLSYSPVHVALALSIPILLLLLVSPASWIPHLSAPFVLLIPVQNTLHSVAVETKKGRSDAKDAQQWALYWASLRSDGPSSELQAAEKKEAAESDKADKEAAKRKEKEEKQEKAAKDAKAKEKEKAKAK
ncbi:hypothetical protein EHS25_009650 [Saitozyma podzolica]|uniref:Uncharacterized protein n=1 Tax=Saitozyma podzolica TaxID=1890683 RepID=A0A427YJV3_9TREE|nr:hypothetical protein EHS25_009650 [Saitozyma podzolica]